MKGIELSSLKVYTKQEIAEQQLDRAICLLLDEKDLICAITLAGAAEEILGELINRNGKKNALEDIVEESISLGTITGNEWKAGTFKQSMSFFRNELKHHRKSTENDLGGLNVIPIPAEVAYEIISRAAENLRRLTDSQSEQVTRFNSFIDNA